MKSSVSAKKRPMNISAVSGSLLIATVAARKTEAVGISISKSHDAAGAKTAISAETVTAAAVIAGKRIFLNLSFCSLFKCFSRANRASGSVSAIPNNRTVPASDSRRPLRVSVFRRFLRFVPVYPVRLISVAFRVSRRNVTSLSASPVGLLHRFRAPSDRFPFSVSSLLLLSRGDNQPL